MSLFKRLFNAVRSGSVFNEQWDEIRSNLISADLGVKLVDQVIAEAKLAKPEDAQLVHAFIRQRLNQLNWPGSSIRILYGGSVNAANAQALFTMPDIDGALVGGAALQATNFLAIGEAAVQRIIAPVPKGN